MQPRDFEDLLRKLNLSNAEFARYWTGPEGVVGGPHTATSTVRRLILGKRRITQRNRVQICETAVEILIMRKLGPLQERGEIIDMSSEGPQSRHPAATRAAAASRPAPGPRPAAGPRPAPAATPGKCVYREFGAGPYCGDRTLSGSRYCHWHHARALVEGAR